jgi:hypothetical protein
LAGVADGEDTYQLVFDYCTQCFSEVDIAKFRSEFPQWYAKVEAEQVTRAIKSALNVRCNTRRTDTKLISIAGEEGRQKT